MQPHRSNALDGAAAALTVARTRGVAMPLSWSWSHQPQGRAWAAASALPDTLIRTPYVHAAHARADGFLFLYSQEKRKPVPKAPRDAGAVPAELPAAAPRAEPEEVEVEEVAATHANKKIHQTPKQRLTPVATQDAH